MPPVTVISFDVGTVNLALWIGQMDGDVYVTQHWELINVHTPNVPSSTIDRVCTCTVDALRAAQNRFVPTDETFVVIESQPTTNIRMKCVSHVIQTWFYCHGFAEDSIKFVSPRNKLTVYTKPLKDDVFFVSNAYRYRKDMSTAHARALLEEHEQHEWLRFLNSHAKKDDLADAYLQGCHSLKRLQSASDRATRRLSKSKKPVAKVKSDCVPLEATVTDDDIETRSEPVK